tara:strand:+ start:6065 stop:6844 length:780 start_codon:yes stop_codon:yes gene_type:complete
MAIKLTQRKISNSSISLSEIGLGTVKFGRNTDIKYPEPFDLPSDNDLIEILNTAAELGVDYLDTAVAYGIANQRLGQLLPKINKKFKIVAKIGERYSPESGSTYDFTRPALEEDFEKLLEELGINFIECLLLHCNDNDYGDDIKDGLKFLKQLKQKGLIGAYGSSCKTKEGVMLALDSDSDVVMIEPNLYYSNPKWLKKNNSRISIMIKKIFNSGKLLNTDKNLSSSEIISKQLTDKNIISVVIGTINHEHLQMNIQNI